MRKIVVLIVIVVIVAVVVAVVMELRQGVSARTAPNAVEVELARTLRHFAVPSAARSMPNPVPLTPQVLDEARAHFADHCAGCHANDGSGRTEMGQNLYPKAPDMRAEATQKLSDGELFSIIQNGVRLTGMPAWGSGSPQDATDSWKLVHFIRHMPHMTPAEIDSMKALNPMSRSEMEEAKEERDFLEGHDDQTH